MGIKKNKVLIFFILLSIHIFCTSIIFSDAFYYEIKEQYQDYLESWINNDISSEQMIQFTAEIESKIEKQIKTPDSQLWLSRTALLRGQIYYERGEKKQSISELERCLLYAEQSDEYEKNSELLSMTAEANGLLMLQKSYLYVIANFSVPQKLALKALEINPENPKASLVAAQYLCNAPPIAGGDLEKGISMLVSLSKKTDISESTRFFILKSLAEVYINNNRKVEAANTCRQALSLFPGNLACRKTISILGK